MEKITKASEMTLNKQPSIVRRRDKKDNEKFRVWPGLSMTSKDIQTRIRNKTLVQGHTGQYTTDPNIVETLKMDKKDILNKARENQEKISGLNSKLNKK